jgi:hypothetical protein
MAREVVSSFELIRDADARRAVGLGGGGVRQSASQPAARADAPGTVSAWFGVGSAMVNRYVRGAREIWPRSHRAWQRHCPLPQAGTAAGPHHDRTVAGASSDEEPWTALVGRGLSQSV